MAIPKALVLGIPVASSVVGMCLTFVGADFVNSPRMVTGGVVLGILPLVFFAIWAIKNSLDKDE